jgi:hypothetical protein
VIFGLTITGVDVKGAFLYPDQESPVYITLPARYTDGEPVYWKMNKTLYGLPDSPQAFYRDVSKFLLQHGYSRTTADPACSSSGYMMVNLSSWWCTSMILQLHQLIRN